MSLGVREVILPTTSVDEKLADKDASFLGGDTPGQGQRRRNGIPQVESSQGIWEKSIKIIQGTQVIIQQAQHLKTVLGTSKGRDKICSMIQYVAKFVYTCQIHSNIEEIQAGLRYSSG